ncbi:MAG TPA: HEPN domain-containing protein [Bacteroidales bacterium]|nr:HEPN domain-containing protein [Bacteroidales bacterium]
MDDKTNIEKTYNHWIKTSDKDFITMMNLFHSKDYHWALFIGHIVIERLLKACVVKETLDHPPFTHDLSKLASLTGMPFTEEHLDWFDTISAFNLNARYDSYKEAFYKKCTHDFTKEWIEKITVLQSWIKAKL